jgi:hypothetical protein
MVADKMHARTVKLMSIARVLLVVIAINGSVALHAQQPPPKPVPTEA